jgi:hypothetical protein
MVEIDEQRMKEKRKIRGTRFVLFCIFNVHNNLYLKNSK